MIRQCKKCGKEKDIFLFLHKKKKNGDIYILHTCIECNKKYTRKYCLNYYQDHKNDLIKNSQGWYQNNIEKKKTYDQIYIIDNKENKKEYDIEYRKINKEKINKRIQQYVKNRKINDPTYKLRKRISGSIWSYLKTNKGGQSILQFLPYTIKELKEHLEKQFEPWMTWNNWGKYIVSKWNDKDLTTWTWQIDHIIPHSNFKYTSMEDDNFKKCWALSNLRPYSAKQNIIDSNKR